MSAFARYWGQPDIDALVRVAPWIERVGRFADLIEGEPDHSFFAALRDAEGTGRPLGSNELVAELERLTGPFTAPSTEAQAERGSEAVEI